VIGITPLPIGTDVATDISNEASLGASSMPFPLAYLSYQIENENGIKNIDNNTNIAKISESGNTKN
jgi:hypothetical protein